MREHGEALEADFARYYQRDLLDLWRGTMTPRKAATLAVALPMGSAVWIAAGSDAAWSQETHMLAGVTDILAGANWQRSDGKGPQPKPLPRPGDVLRAKSKESAARSHAARFKARQLKREAVGDER